MRLTCLPYLLLVLCLLKTVEVMEEQWIEDLRKRFSDKKVAPPDDLWSRIESALPEHGVSVGKADTVPGRTRMVRLWAKRMTVAAACIAVLGGAGWLFLSRGSVDTNVSDNVAASGIAAVTSVKTPASVPAAKDKHQSFAHAVRRVVVNAMPDVVPETFAAPVTEEKSENVATDTIEVKAEAVSADEVRSVERNSHFAGRSSDKRAGLHDEEAQILANLNSPSGRHKDVAVAVYGSDMTSFGGSSVRQDVMNMPLGVRQDCVFGSDVRALLAMTDDNSSDAEANEIKVKHRQPVKVGMSVRFALAGRFGIETGLNYSYHSSDIASGDDKGGYSTEQKLHYVGVPLGLNYDVWHTDMLEVYVSAGAMAEFCVSGRSHTEYVSGNTVVNTADIDVRDKRPQWSVNASAGIQYNFNDILGIYAEPGVGYYFDNGTNITNIYKEKPFNFNLNVGLRFTVR